MSDIDGFTPGLILGFLLGLFIFGMLCQVKVSNLQQEAIKAGVAHHVIIDTNTGKTEFQWIKKEASRE